MDPHVWQRFPLDSDEAFAAFCEWLHLPSPRLAVDEWARGQATKASPGRPGLILKWYMENYWEERAAAYDHWVAQAPLRKQYPVSHPMILGVMRMCLAELKKYEAAQSRAGDAPGYFSMGDCLKMMSHVLRAEKEIARLTKEQEKAKESGAVVQDFSRLSLEEARIFDTLLAKVTAI